jgi:hypothetical protein
MKAKRFKFEGKRHPAILVQREIAYNKLVNQCDAILVDGEDACFQNNGDTLVIALAELNDASNADNSQIHEWVDGYIDLLLEAVAELKPNEFEIQPLSGMKGYSRIVRFWWD